MQRRYKTHKYIPKNRHLRIKSLFEDILTLKLQV
jgi:hypothetical protein